MTAQHNGPSAPDPVHLGLKPGGSNRGWIPHCPYLGAGCVALKVTQLVLHQHVAQVVDLDQVPQVQVISAQAWVG
jgi:hypothetical protein